MFSTEQQLPFYYIDMEMGAESLSHYIADRYSGGNDDGISNREGCTPHPLGRIGGCPYGVVHLGLDLSVGGDPAHPLVASLAGDGDGDVPGN